MTRDYLGKWQRRFDAARRLAPKIEKTIGCDEGGYYAEFYDEDTEKVGRWYGTREECEAIGAESVEMYPVCWSSERPDPSEDYDDYEAERARESRLERGLRGVQP